MKMRAFNGFYIYLFLFSLLEFKFQILQKLIFLITTRVNGYYDYNVETWETTVTKYLACECVNARLCWDLITSAPETCRLRLLKLIHSHSPVNKLLWPSGEIIHYAVRLRSDIGAKLVFLTSNFFLFFIHLVLVLR